ncbi:Uncharacterized protein YhaN [Alteribacillus persepolensis]|uniref:Uncharacterized protein YhaN n=1 Tax=Alteribacillus persepolensis TaxID=568899 RepID=A0A1G8DEF0_9BACI|nr:AAA family ATPase [Alteribacillus persepolensis]SDH55690.1 Uncharacterized protein YhaN [Alteribacillus persepolensis]
MRIVKLHIYGFGKFHDFTLEFHHPIQVIYGRNESGKTTLRAFVQAILFGFPTKKEKLLRYEPKKSSSYGGNLTLMLDNQETITVERVMKHKAAGDITVHRESGETAGEKEWSAWLGKVDRATFQGIFCFGLDGLNELNQLKGTALNRYIYEAGMTGTKQVSQIDKELGQKLDQLFKPRGQKPIINKKAKEVNKQYRNVKEWDNEFDRYHILLQQEQTLNEQLRRIKRDKKDLFSQKEQWQRRQTVVHMLQEKKEIERKLDILASSRDVPLEAEDEWAQYYQKKNQAAFEYEESAIQITHESMKYTNAAVSWKAVKLLEKTRELKEQLPLYKKYIHDKDRLEFSIQKKQDTMNDRIKRLGITNEKTLRRSNTSIFAEEELYQLIEKGKEYKERKRILEEQYMEQNNKISQVESDLHDMKQQQRSLPERHGAAVQEAKRSFFTRSFLLQITAGLFFGLGVWQAAVQHVFMSIVLFVAALFLFLAKSEKKAATLSKSSYQEQKDISGTDSWIETAVRERQWQLERETAYAETLSERMKDMEAKWEETTDDLHRWCVTHHFPLIDNIHAAEHIFITMREYNDLYDEYQRLKNEWNAVDEQVQAIAADVQRTAEQMNAASDDSIEELIVLLIEKAEHENQRNDVLLKQADKFVELYEQKQSAKQKQRQYTQKVAALYQSVHAYDKESFLQSIEKKKQYLDVNKQHRWLSEQIAAQLEPGESETGWLENVLDDDTKQMETMDNEVEALEEEEQHLHQQTAEVKQKLKTLEENGTYEQQLQQYQQGKEELQENMHQWLVLKTAKQLMEHAKSVYEKDRQPYVIQEASRYFSFITNERYTRLFAPIGLETFMVEDKEGIRYSPDELSRGTAEQLYLSLRFALAASYQEYTVFPFVMDDPFVNFDVTRQKAAFSLLKKAAEDRQIIYFTCHELPESFEHDYPVEILSDND